MRLLACREHYASAKTMRRTTRLAVDWKNIAGRIVFCELSVFVGRRRPHVDKRNARVGRTPENFTQFSQRWVGFAEQHGTLHCYELLTADQAGLRINLNL